MGNGRSRRVLPGWVYVLLAAWLTTGLARASGPVDTHRASGIDGGSYDDIISSLRALQARYPDVVSTGTYGNSVRGKPLFFVKLAKAKASVKAPRVVVMTQAIHGNEYLGIVDRLPAEFLQFAADYPAINAFLDTGGVFYLIPVMNPDGYEASRRTNENGVDLNRDFDVKRYIERVAKALKGEISYTEYELSTLKAYVERPKQTQPESRQLAEWITRDVASINGRVKISFDYHCCQGDDFGSLMHSWGDTKTLRDGTIPGPDVVRYESAAAHFQATFPGHLWGSGYEIVQYLTFGTTDEWFYETFSTHGALSFCYEGQRYNEDRKLKQHARMWDRLLGDPAMIP